MPRAGLNTDRVVAAAADLADEVGLDHLTLAALAAERGAAPGDAEHELVARQTVEVIAAVMGGYSLDGDDAFDAIRAYRAALHGFVSLEANHGFAFPASIDRSFERVVRALVRVLSSFAASLKSSSGWTGKFCSRAVPRWTAVAPTVA